MKKIFPHLTFEINVVPYITTLIVGVVLGGASTILVVRHFLMEAPAQTDVLYVSETQPRANGDGVISAAALTPGRPLTREDLGRCYNNLKPTGFPPPHIYIEGKPVPGQPGWQTVGEVKDTNYTESQLKQCLDTLDKLAPLSE